MEKNLDITGTPAITMGGFGGGRGGRPPPPPFYLDLVFFCNPASFSGR